MITELGKWVAKLPFHPIFGVFVHDALELNIGIEALVLTARRKQTYVVCLVYNMVSGFLVSQGVTYIVLECFK
jgi:hypothetical protein